MLPSVAVVILNWNGRKYLEQFLPSVVAASYSNYFVVVADNASSDDSVHYVQQHFPSVRILSNEQNEGFARGYNLSLKQVDADYYVLLNSDVAVSVGWIDPVIQIMEEDTAIAACQPKILSYANPKLFEYAGACGGWIDKFAYPFARGRIFDTCEPDEGQYDTASRIFWASGAAMFVRAKVFHECNGFDEYFFAHQEEIDLCWRMQLAGYKIFVQPLSVVYHVGGGTLAMGSSHKMFLNFRNNLIMMSKNNTLGASLWKVPFRIGLDNIAAIKSLLRGDGGTWLAIIRAHFHYLHWLFFRQSRSVFAKYRSSDLFGVYKGLVIWQYFAKGKKTFNQIMNRG